MNLEKLFSNKVEISQNRIFTTTGSRPLGFAQEQTNHEEDDCYSERFKK